MLYHHLLPRSSSRVIGSSLSWCIGPFVLILVCCTLCDGFNVGVRKRPTPALALKWRPFNFREETHEEDNTNANGNVMSLFDVEDFVDGLKSKITSEISLLLAIDPEASLEPEAPRSFAREDHSKITSRQEMSDYLTDNDKNNLRRFLPMFRGRTRRD
ncbi:hypothetical protein TCAL_13887 [Tigriopus californicus]|uniref:Uncharacterized protein n=1 Tax=Tigriopus californicus TaxID=6832 RepID=A0A553N6N1_TIGCA|nr:uncharacterized protein LOC131885797 [Tigriopus californicus]TRY61060.1 hypothetical protein TCAL_13887 [Tigriopus californicus]|eukprot:TCALIF_13887-PA protein Name:"Protein of unknown function" AED:0.00 eAED:0.00 QI:24/1/1/1/0/0/2/362/157